MKTVEQFLASVYDAVRSALSVVVKNTDPIEVVGASTPTLITSGTIAANGTNAVTVDIAIPAGASPEGKYNVFLANPNNSSEVMTVTLMNKKTIGAVSYYPKLTSWSIATADAAQGVETPVQGFLIGLAGRISFVLDGSGTGEVPYEIWKA